MLASYYQREISMAWLLQKIPPSPTACRRGRQVRFLVETLATRRVEFHYIHGTDVHAGRALQRPATVTFFRIYVCWRGLPIFFYTVLCAARPGWCLAAMPMNTISSSQGL